MQRNATSSELQENERRSPGIASEGPVMYTTEGATVEKDMIHISKKGNSYSHIHHCRSNCGEGYGTYFKKRGFKAKKCSKVDPKMR